jgi:hypothetical protein
MEKRGEGKVSNDCYAHHSERQMLSDAKCALSGLSAERATSRTTRAT